MTPQREIKDRYRLFYAGNGQWHCYEVFVDLPMIDRGLTKPLKR